MSDLDAALARLDDYVRRHAADGEVEDYEQDLFARALAGAAPELGLRERFEATLRWMNARGSLDFFMTAREVAELDQRGLRIRHYVLDLANPVEPDLSGDFDLLVTKVPIDLTGIRHVDAEILTPEGVHLKTMRDIGFDPADGAVYMCCEAELARFSAGAKTITRVWAHEESGRRLLHEISFAT
jgi:hypothetical protein